jgi:hypothetical protein
MKAYGGVEVQIHEILSSALDGDEWSASRNGRFTPRARAPGSHWVGGWMGLRAGLDTVVKIKIPRPCRDSNPEHPARSPALYHWAIPASTPPSAEVKNECSYTSTPPIRHGVVLS